MISKKILSLIVAVGLCSSIMAKQNVIVKEVSKIGTQQGMFTDGKENFPKDYLLVHNNLPHLIKLSLYDPNRSILKLSQKQIDNLVEIQKKQFDKLINMSKKVKSLELQLAQNIAIDNNTAQSQYELVEQIARIRIDLTKIHLKCITKVRKILTKEQYKKLLTYAINKSR